MIRTTLLFVYVLVLAGYARRDWFVPLCGGLLLMGVVQHPDMPKSIAGVQGLNPWNFLMAGVLLSWLTQRSARGLAWDLPPKITCLLIAYGAVVVWAFVRMMSDRSGIEGLTTAYLVSEDLVNCVKWVLPGLILYDTCRTRKQLEVALFALLGIYVILAIQVINRMPLSYAFSGDDLAYRASKIVQKEIGYNRVNMSMLLSGASWALVATTILFKQSKTKILILACAALVILGQALTAGRMGYATWILVGLILSVLRWRRALPIIPAGAVLITLFLPGVQERLLDGFGWRQGSLSVESDHSEITSGRTVIWPYVVEKIKEAPVLGYGRRAMVRTGLADFLGDELNEEFPHPHNAYLEMLLDNGVVGLLLVLPFYVLVVWRAIILFRDRTDPLAAAVGGATLALVLALLIAAMGSQTFYPREGSVGMWAAIGLMLRLSVERKKVGQGALLFKGELAGAQAREQGRLRWPRRPVAVDRRWAASSRQPELQRSPVVRAGNRDRVPVTAHEVPLRRGRATRVRHFARNGEPR